jgi:hypothetical protein
MSRKLLLNIAAAVTLILTGAALVGPVFRTPGKPKTPFRVKYDRIRRGMTIEEVRAIMGEPMLPVVGLTDGSQDLETYDTKWKTISEPIQPITSEPEEKADVWFVNGRVSEKDWILGEDEPTQLDLAVASVRDWLGR